MSKLGDRNILEYLQSDQTTGMRLLFERYYTLLVVYAERMLRDRSLAEDLVQDFFIRLWKDNYLKNVSAATLGPYLFTGIRNSALTQLKKKDFFRNPVALSSIEVPIEVFTSINDERIERVMQEIERLPERTRQVVEAVMLHEQKYKEVAEEMEISVNTVKFLLKEGTRRLREKFAEQAKNMLLIFLRKK